MKQFNSIEEMQPYLNEKKNTYEFIENGEVLDIEINFDLTTYKNIFARDINAGDITVLSNLDARNIKAWDIISKNINAWNIAAVGIDAWDISFYAVCYAYKNIVCKSIKGRRKNSKYFSLDGEVIIKGEK